MSGYCNTCLYILNNKYINFQLQDLEQKLSEKEELYRKELLRLQTNSDRDMLELRRKLDKMDLSYQEQLEKKQELHEQEIGKDTYSRNETFCIRN